MKDKDDIRARLVIVDHEKQSIEFQNLQSLYRAIELLEDRPRQFFIVER